MGFEVFRLTGCTDAPPRFTPSGVFPIALHPRHLDRLLYRRDGVAARAMPVFMRSSRPKADSANFLSPPKGSGAPKDASLWCPRSFWDRGGRLTARHLRLSALTRFALLERGCSRCEAIAPFKRMLFAAISFRRRAALLAFGAALWAGGRRAIFQLRYRPSAYLSAEIKHFSQLLAGTRSGPGRSPGAARVPDPRDQTRGRRAPSRLDDRLAMAPFNERSAAMIVGRRSAGIRFSGVENSAKAWRVAFRIGQNGL
jgi:hypothetical protein